MEGKSIPADWNPRFPLISFYTRWDQRVDLAAAHVTRLPLSRITALERPQLKPRAQITIADSERPRRTMGFKQGFHEIFAAKAARQSPGYLVTMVHRVYLGFDQWDSSFVCRGECPDRQRQSKLWNRSPHTRPSPANSLFFLKIWGRVAVAGLVSLQLQEKP